MTIDPKAFSSAYRGAVADVMPFVTREKQLLIARHDQSFNPDRYSLHAYLEASEKRYACVVELLNRHGEEGGEPGALDAGGFLAAFPLALARLGIPATIAEVYAYYHGALDDLRDYLQAQGVRVWDVDLTKADASPPAETFGLVTSMAMIEHLPDSPKPLLENLRQLVGPRGRLMLETPNIAYWPTRLKAIRGRSVHQALELVYHSEQPYIGHHREYTEQELRDVLEWSGFAVDQLVTYNYSLDFRGIARKLRFAYYAPAVLRRCREVLLACARPIDGRAGADSVRGKRQPPS